MEDILHQLQPSNSWELLGSGPWKMSSINPGFRVEGVKGLGLCDLGFMWFGD